VVFSEFRRRVKDNRNGKAAPMFIIGGSNKGNFIEIILLFRLITSDLKKT
jgi:hypothetical protein